MEMVAFGKTGVLVSKMGLGMAALGRPGYINLNHSQDLSFGYGPAEMQLQAEKVLERAYNEGIRYFDVARSYGNGEEFLSGWLHKHPEWNPVIGSKWGYVYTADWQIKAPQHEVKDLSVANLKRQWPESNKILGSKLKIYHIHSATLESGVLDDQGVIKKLWELKETGVTVGLSVSGTGQSKTIERAMEETRDETLLFESVQCTYNLLEQSASRTLMEASERGCGIIIKEVLANGRLTNRNQSPEFEEKLKTLGKIAAKHRVGIDAICIAWVLKAPWATTVLSGAATVEQLLSNLQAFKVVLDDEDLVILNQFMEESSVYWKKRSELEWN